MEKSIFITARFSDDGFDSFLGPSLQKIQTKCVNVSDSETSDGIKTISTKYNIGINIAKEQQLVSNETIVVFSKSDVHVLDPLVMDKLELIFNELPNMMVVGVVGVNELHRGRNLYNIDNKPVNSIIYKKVDSDTEGEHIKYSDQGFYTNVVGVDDSIIAVRGSFINSGFMFTCDTNTGFGIDVAINATKQGYDVGVADILVVSKNTSDVDYNDIESVLDAIDVSLPVNIKNISNKGNSLVDVEI